jgi:RNA polymerase sigma-70 factor (ECF subfamily)
MADRSKFEEMALPYLDTLYRVALTLCRRPTKADDLVQTAYLKGLRNFASYRTGTNLKAWLIRILRNTWIDELRHSKVAGPSHSLEEQWLPDPAGEDPSDVTVNEDLLERFSDQDVIRALQDLPEEQRITLLLLDVEDLSQDEVAEITNVAVGTVKSRSSRARRTLKTTLLDHARDRGFVERIKS